MKPLILAVLLLTSGCLAQTEEPTPEPPPDACPAIACGWAHRPGTNPGTDTETCPSEQLYRSERHYESLGGVACWVYETACVPPGTSAECVPDVCRRTFAECQPHGAPAS